METQFCGLVNWYTVGVRGTNPLCSQKSECDFSLFCLFVDLTNQLQCIWKKFYVSGSAQFKPMLFKDQLFFFICSEFCHTLKWNSHGFTCVPHPDPPTHLPLQRINFYFRTKTTNKQCWEYESHRLLTYGFSSWLLKIAHQSLGFTYIRSPSNLHLSQTHKSDLILNRHREHRLTTPKVTPECKNWQSSLDGFSKRVLFWIHLNLKWNYSEILMIYNSLQGKKINIRLKQLLLDCFQGWSRDPMLRL